MDTNVKLNKRKKVSLDARKARSGYVFVAPFIIGVIIVAVNNANRNRR